MVHVKRPGDLKPDERRAAAKGGEAAGGYLDQIGKTDLAKLSIEEWQEFCALLFVGACDEMRARAEDEVPF